eukprot:8357701-Pyramimonas_sp.AAC.1
MSRFVGPVEIEQLAKLSFCMRDPLLPELLKPPVAPIVHLPVPNLHGMLQLAPYWHLRRERLACNANMNRQAQGNSFQPQFDWRMRATGCLMPDFQR